MPAPFDPTAHPALAELGDRLRDLAGHAAYAAGRDYLRKGMVRDGTVAGTIAYASVTGSTVYRVSVDFGDAPKVTCTCLAHRRNKHCKHVVAVAIALLERSGEFTPIEPVAPPPKPRRARRAATTTPNKAALRAEQQAGGLAMLDRLIEELAAGGLASLGSEQQALLANAAETVRALKLRRLGNLTKVLQRLAANGGDGRDGPERFASVLTDLYLTRRVVGAHLAGHISLDPGVAEDLIGKTWRASELDPLTNLDLIPLAETRTDDGEFRVETDYLGDEGSGEIYVERHISPLALATKPKEARRDRLVVEEAGRYPGLPPRRLKLIRSRRAPLTVDHVARFVAHATTRVPDVRRRLADRLAAPASASEAAVAFRPAAMMIARTDRDRLAARDGDGHVLLVDWPAAWTPELRLLLPDPGRYILFGLLRLGDDGPELRCLSIVGELRWGRGPIYPDTR